MKKLLFSLILFTQISLAQSIPGVGGMVPTSGSGSGPQTFTATINLPAGPGNGDYMLISLGGAPGCTVMVRPLDNIMYILNDDGTGWQSPATIGSNMTIQNKYCAINVGATFKWVYAYSEVAAISVTFKAIPGSNPGWAGVYAYSGATNTTSNWITTGSWTVPQTIFDSLSTADVTLQDQILDDYDGTYVTRPSSIHPWSVRLKSGKVVKIAAADNFQMKNFSYSHEISGNSFIYKYVMDTKPLWMWRLGQTTELDAFELDPSTKTLSAPKGWSDSPGGSDSVDDDAERSEKSEFVLQSDWRPGILPMYLCDAHAKEPIPYFPDTNSNERLSKIGIFTNSQLRFVIGPAIRPEATPDDMKILLKHWVNDYGFVFLKPLLEDGKTLDDVQTDIPFEQEVLACLRAAQSK